VRLGSVVVGVSYATPELHFRLGVVFNVIQENALAKREPKNQFCEYNIIVK
jgi:hypothetical protein